MPPEKLLSCPFCGSNNKRPVVQKTLCVRPYVVMCFQCFAQTSEYNTEEEAMFAWNTRTSSPELVELRKDKERLDWLDRNLISLYDGGGAWIIEFGLLHAPTCLGKDVTMEQAHSGDYLGTPRQAIDEAMKEKK